MGLEETDVIRPQLVESEVCWTWVFMERFRRKRLIISVLLILHVAIIFVVNVSIIYSVFFLSRI